MDLEKGAGLTLDRRMIPPKLHFFVPYVEKWSFHSLDDQDAFAAQMQRHRPDEIGPFNRAADDAAPLIRDWGKTLPCKAGYATYVSILEGFDDLLTTTQQKKLSLANRKTGGG